MGTISVSLPPDGTTADVSDYNTPVTTIVNAINGNLDNANIASGAAIAGSKMADNSVDLQAKASADSGWRAVTDSWTYASASTITVPSDATAKYGVGDRVRFTQTLEKHFIITAVTATILTVFGPDGDVVANAAISAIYYSKVGNPQGMPSQGVSWYQEIGRTSLSVEADSISLPVLPARKYLKLYISLINNSTISRSLRFNGDSGNTYNFRFSTDGAADTATGTQAELDLTSDTTANSLSIVEIVNILAQEKLDIGQTVAQNTAGVGNVVDKWESSGKWVNTAAQITRVDVINTAAGGYAAGSELIVLGHD